MSIFLFVFCSPHIKRRGSQKHLGTDTQKQHKLMHATPINIYNTHVKGSVFTERREHFFWENSELHPRALLFVLYPLLFSCPHPFLSLPHLETILSTKPLSVVLLTFKFSRGIDIFPNVSYLLPFLFPFSSYVWGKNCTQATNYLRLRNLFLIKTLFLTNRELLLKVPYVHEPHLPACYVGCDEEVRHHGRQ